MEFKNLVRVKTFAKEIGKSTECIRSWLSSGFMKATIIDGCFFIDTDVYPISQFTNFRKGMKNG